MNSSLVDSIVQLDWLENSLSLRPFFWLMQGSVIVIRYEGPKGGPGMPEMLTPTSAVIGAGLGQDVALIQMADSQEGHMALS